MERPTSSDTCGPIPTAPTPEARRIRESGRCARRNGCSSGISGAPCRTSNRTCCCPGRVPSSAGSPDTSATAARTHTGSPSENSHGSPHRNPGSRTSSSRTACSIYLVSGRRDRPCPPPPNRPFRRPAKPPRRGPALAASTASVSPTAVPRTILGAGCCTAARRTLMMGWTPMET